MQQKAQQRAYEMMQQKAGGRTVNFGCVGMPNDRLGRTIKNFLWFGFFEFCIFFFVFSPFCVISQALLRTHFFTSVCRGARGFPQKIVNIDTYKMSEAILLQSRSSLVVCECHKAAWRSKRSCERTSRHIRCLKQFYYKADPRWWYVDPGGSGGGGRRSRRGR